MKVSLDKRFLHLSGNVKGRGHTNTSTTLRERAVEGLRRTKTRGT